MAKYFPNSDSISQWITSKKNTITFTTIKMAKAKHEEKILKVAREKWDTLQSAKTEMLPDFSSTKDGGLKSKETAFQVEGTLQIPESEKSLVCLRICKETSLSVAERVSEPCMDMHDQGQRQRPGKEGSDSLEKRVYIFQ